MVRDRLLSSPPLEARGAGPAAPAPRTTTGVPGLDALLGGGLPEDRAVVVCGATGTGKTTFALQFLLEGARRGEPGIFVTVDAKPRHLVADAAASLGWDFSEPMTRGDILVLDASPYFTATRTGTWTGRGIDARHIAGDLVQQVRRIGARRLAIDSITSLVPPDLGRAHAFDYLRSLVQSWEDNLGCTVLLTCRGARRDGNGSCDAARTLASGVLELRLVACGADLVRTLRVRKMRGAAVHPAECPITIERHTGLAIAEPLDVGAVSRMLRPPPHPLGDAGRRPSGHPAAVSRA